MPFADPENIAVAVLVSLPLNRVASDRPKDVTVAGITHDAVTAGVSGGVGREGASF